MCKLQKSIWDSYYYRPSTFFRISVARNDWRQVRAAQEKIDEQRSEIESKLWDAVIYSDGMVSYAELLQLNNHQIQMFVKRFTEYTEQKNQAVKKSRQR